MLVDINRDMTSNLKTAIAKELQIHVKSMQPLTDSQITESVFYHENSLRLSYTGFVAMSKIFTAYQFPAPYKMIAKHYMALSKMDYPYYITANRLVLFSDSDATVIKLAGSVEHFLETNFQLDR